MGDIADMILDGTLDEQTGEYLGDAVGYPRTRERGYYNSIPDTPSEKKIKKVRKELAILITQKVKEFPDKGQNLIVNTCREFINLKYGKGWRERGFVVNDEDQWKELNQYKTPEFDWEYSLNKYKNK